MEKMRKAATPPNEFATAMQQLSAEAAKIIPPASGQSATGLQNNADVAELTVELQSLHGRLEDFQDTIAEKLEQLSSKIGRAGASDFSTQFQKIEEQLGAIHASETVNQRLFDSLHDELLAYRDNFLHESLQKPFIHDLVHLFDDLTSLSDQLRNAAALDARGSVSQWRDNLENAIHSLVEILHRFEVKEIEPKENVDRALHKVVSYEPADYAEEDGRIIMRVRRGFFWRGKLIRPEEVIAKRFG
jgi:molecular chaperone GrpE (heat shock protein)